MPLTRQAVANKIAPRTVTVEVPEWGDVAIVKAMSVGQLLSFEAARKALRSEGEVFALLVAYGVVDGETGDPLFTFDEALAIGGDQLPILVRLGHAVIEVNGMSQDAQEQAVGNS